MAPRFSSALAIFMLASLALASSATAIGIGKQRALTPADRSAGERTASASALIAPAASCPDQNLLSASLEAQEQAMLCMTNFARANAGLPSLGDSEQLDLSAQQKAGDVLRCSFSHFACGREFTYWIRQSGYIGESCWHAGENLAWGMGELGSVRAIFQAWMDSPTHRRNILGDYREIGIDLELGQLEGQVNARVWTSHFGSRCEVPPVQ